MKETRLMFKFMAWNPSQVNQMNDIDAITHLFKGIDSREIHRPKGEIDVLIGCNYAALHPSIIQSVGNLTVMKNRFGKCLAGSHPLLNYPLSYYW